MHEKSGLVLEWESGESAIGEFLRGCRISQTTAYRNLHRHRKYRRQGRGGRSRAPRRVPNRTPKVLGYLDEKTRRIQDSLGRLARSQRRE